MRNRYNYEYEWDEEYCYSNSNVLKNKLNITSEDDLSVAEREITSLKISAAKVRYIKGKFDFNHLKKIHKYIFNDIYSWAGHVRNVNISKGNQFCLCNYIESNSEKLFEELKNESYLIYSQEKVPERLAYYLSEINVIHPFREGNGRAQRLFIEYLAMVAGYTVDFSDVSANEMIEASAEAYAKHYDKMVNLFKRISTPISKEKQVASITFFFGKIIHHLHINNL